MRARWLQRYRLLVVAYGVTLASGARELVLEKRDPIVDGVGCEASAASCFATLPNAPPGQDSAYWRRNARMVEVLDAVNPGDPDTDFLAGAQALSRGDQAEFIRRFERALESGPKHNALLLQFYAQSLLDRQADWRVVNRAVNRWRENHPLSRERLRLELAAGPHTPSDVRALVEELTSVPWIEDAQLVPYVKDGREQWRVNLSFRPGRPIDVRQAIAAATLLAIPEAQRPFYAVSCLTLEDCSVGRRQGAATRGHTR